ncbi:MULTISPECIES: succinylglutamate desuccinylase/aspartoacylase family protein [unclassified Streptomyces]|uniref:succinylglutamate desuccinylase/aspartoacylase family protein n=1 Tax=unclassified Streptomyces TaxID=2593676 RepID=UPI002DDB0AFF|nr:MULTISPECIES: succinylglutamate desuccinylase/aspartoacylase family protein [unclassified Streptomyces]WSA91075.1 succinylglutamate desuccinylase/aspartoacylase family protein [Streptomyces sp. NBC_01795]WSB75400.1 succinylglutamate desuccinylase/aspartoacylase family protein [Streptomyces sp. NBC_01775]WSS45135.1 succinylglutamate desuccinylase/aspartoacylase family protein [Streptomyces sp. NBC_01187]
MTGTLSVGSLSAEPGGKTRGSVPADLGTLTVDIPLTLVNGARPGPRVVITAGVHGGEFTGIDAAARLAARLEPGDVRGQVIVCPVANPPVVYQGRVDASPLDGVNINRVFPGDPDGRPTERLAAWLFAHLVDGADAYVDLHSGGIDETLRDFVGYRLTGDAGLDAKAADMARSLGIEDVVLGLNADGGNSHAAAARRGIPAVLVESGQLGERDEDAARRLVDGLHSLLRRLGVLDPRDTPDEPAPAHAWVWAGAVAAEATGLWYPEFTAGDDVTASQVIGHIIDPVDGQEHKVRTPVTGRVFYGMHALTVAPGAELAAIAASASEHSGNSDPGETADRAPA